MSGGRFDYLQSRYEWEDALEVIGSHLKDNPDEYTDETLKRFRTGLELIKKAKIYLQRIDYLLSGDDGEETFHKRIKEDHKKENLKLD